MAAYNGAAYIREQLDSILTQLGSDDEIVIVDDASQDATITVIGQIADPRIRVIQNSVNRGYVKSFERAIESATGDIIFLTDQDDVWVSGRVTAMADALSDTELVVTNFGVFGGALPKLQQSQLRASDSNHWRRNTLALWIGTRLYYGCCMAFRAEMKDRLLPFPTYLTETHDQWIGYVGNADHSVTHLEMASVNRRLHDANATVSTMRPLVTILRARFMTLRAILEARRRRRRSS